MVSDNVMIAFFRKEFDRESSDISNSVCASLFTSGGTNTAQNRSFLSNTLEELSPRYMGDVIRDFEFSPCTCSFGMDNPRRVNQHCMGIESRWKPTFPEYAHD